MVFGAPARSQRLEGGRKLRLCAECLPEYLGAIVTKGIYMHDGVDWKAAPNTAHWWAVDADGKAHWFKPPNVAAFTSFWFTESEQAPPFDYSGDWRESLAALHGR